MGGQLDELFFYNKLSHDLVHNDIINVQVNLCIAFCGMKSGVQTTVLTKSSTVKHFTFAKKL